MTNREALARIKWRLPGTIAYLSMYVIALIGLYVAWFYAPNPFTQDVIWGIVLGYYCRMLLVTMIGHRCMSHKAFAFKDDRLLVVYMALFSTCVQKDPLWWGYTHRRHHRYSDQVGDPHDSRLGFVWSQWAWFLSGDYDDTDFDKIRDLTEIPGAMTIRKYYLVGPIVLGAVYFLVGWFMHSGEFTNPFHSALYMLSLGFFGSTVLLSNGTSFINSLAHKMGRQKYTDTGDNSRNSWILALLTLGEGFHNNHHHDQNKAWSGEGCQRILDITGQVIWLHDFFGLLKRRVT